MIVIRLECLGCRVTGVTDLLWSMGDLVELVEAHECEAAQAVTSN